MQWTDVTKTQTNTHTLLPGDFPVSPENTWTQRNLSTQRWASPYPQRQAGGIAMLYVFAGWFSLGNGLVWLSRDDYAYSRSGHLLPHLPTSSAYMSQYFSPCDKSPIHSSRSQHPKLSAVHCHMGMHNWKWGWWNIWQRWKVSECIMTKTSSKLKCVMNLRYLCQCWPALSHRTIGFDWSLGSTQHKPYDTNEHWNTAVENRDD